MTEKEIIYSQTGKRKTAVAVAFLKKGSGFIQINNLQPEAFFSHKSEECERIKTAFRLIDILDKYDTEIYVKGGGISAQTDAIRLAITKTICKINSKYRLVLSQSSLLFRDSRIKERRKYGLKKARKAPQYSKR